MPHFSDTSKMPCLSWGIPANLCKIGRRLRESGKSGGKLTPCTYCYCFSGRISFSNVQKKLQGNWEEYKENPNEWVKAMEREIKRRSLLYFRFFHSGDLQSLEMLEKIVEIALRCEKVYFWLPTQERPIVKSFLKRGGMIPDNLNVRISSPLVDVPQETKLNGLTASFVSLEVKAGFECPAQFQNGNCDLCRACWEKEVDLISYPLKSGKHYRPKTAKHRKK